MASRATRVTFGVCILTILMMDGYDCPAGSTGDHRVLCRSCGREVWWSLMENFLITPTLAAGG